MEPATEKSSPPDDGGGGRNHAEARLRPRVILFRLRRWGAAGWSYLSLHSEDEDDGDVRSLVSSVIGSSLATSDLHVQIRTEEEEWEDLE